MASINKFFKNIHSSQLPVNIFLFLFFCSIVLADILYRGFEIFWILALGANLIIWSILYRPKKIVLNYEDLAIVFFTIYTFIHYLLFSKQNIFQINFWVLLGYPICFFYFKSLISRNKNVITIFLNSVLVVALIENTIAYLQLFKLIDSSNTFFDFAGTFYSPNMLAFYLAISCVIIVWKFLNLKLSILQKIMHLFLFVFEGILLVAITSRSSYLAVFFGIICILITHKKIIQRINTYKIQKKAIAILAICLLGFFSLKKLYNLKKDSADSRIFIAERTIDLIKEKPFLGNGIFSFKGNYNIAKASYFESTSRPWSEIKNGGYTYHAFNEFLYIIYEIGLLGFGVIMLIFIFLFLKFQLNRNQSIALAILVMLFLFSLFSYPIYVPHIAMIGVFCAAIISSQKKGNFLQIKNGLLTTTSKFLCGVLGLFLTYLAFHKLLNRLEIKKYYESSEYRAQLDKQDLIKLFNRSNDIGESKFYLGYELFQRGYKEEGVKLMYESFPITAEPKMGKILAQSLMDVKDYRKAEKIHKINIFNEPFRFKPRMDYGLLLKKCNRLFEQGKILEEVVALPMKIPSEEANQYKKNAESFLKKYKRYIATQPKIKGSLSINKAIYSYVLNKKIKYKIYLPSIKYIEKPLPVIYFTDGQLFADNDYFINTIDDLISSHKIKPVSLVFIDPREIGSNINLRNEYYLCNQNYSRFVVEELLPFIEERSPVSKKAEERGFWGQSFGGLFAMYISNLYPNYFKNIILQSPAFYPCSSIYEEFAYNPRRDFKIYMSYGTDINDTENQDLPMIQILRDKNYDLKVNRIENGKHNQTTWMKQVEEIMVHFFDRSY